MRQQNIQTNKRSAKMRELLIGLVLLLSPMLAFGQQITGDTTADTGQTKTYTIVLTYTPLGNSWSVTGGTVTSTTENHTTNTYTADIQWNSVGTQTVTFSSMSGTIDTHDVTVSYPPLNAGAITGAHTICYNADGSNLSNSTLPSGGTGSYTYQWQSKLSVGGSWADISGATSTSYDPGNLTGSTDYRRKVVSGSQTAYSNEITITVHPDLTGGGGSGNQNVCYNASPTTLSADSPTGGDGTYTYQWQSRSPGGTFANVSGASSASYNPPSLTANMEYQRLTSSCGQTKTSNVMVMTIYSDLTVGTTSGNQTICNGSTPSQLSATAPSGGNGSYAYQWEQQVNGGAWTDISGATALTYTPGSLSFPTSYRLKVTSCGTTKTTNLVQVSLDSDATGTIQGTNSYYNYATGQITLVGNSGTIVDWEKRLQGTSTWQSTSIATATLSFTNELLSYEFQVKVDNGTCGIMTTPVNLIEVTKEQNATAGSISAPHVITIPNSTNDTLKINASETILSSTLEYYQPHSTGWQTLSCGSCVDTYQIGYATMNFPVQPLYETGSRTYRATYTTASGTFTTPQFTVKYIGEVDTSLVSKQYVKQYTLLAAETSSGAVDGLDSTKVVQSIQYVDGLGRGVQSVVVDGSPTGKDLVSFAEFDAYGRSAKSYLPFTASDATNTHYYSTAATLQSSFYNGTTGIPVDANPYAETKYDTSPYGRVLEQGAPGAAWQLGTGHTPTFDYRYNSTGEVLQWKPDATCAGYYAAGTLYVNELTDENGNKVITYSDAEGKQIQKKTQSDTNTWLVTQNIYDDYGRLLYVLPPKVYDELNLGTVPLANNYTLVLSNYTVTDTNYSGGNYYYVPGAVIELDPDFVTTTDFEVDVYPNIDIGLSFPNDLVFQYTYDSDGRVVEKKVPGSAPTYYVYDMYDQLLLTQDGNTRKTNQWAFVKYDDRGRPVYSGLYTDNTNTTRAAMQSVVDTINYSAGAKRFESATTGATGYTNLVFPTQYTDVLTINYYDDYNFDRTGGDDYSYASGHLTGLPTGTETYSRGLSTSSKTKILGTSNWLQTVVFYDNKGRAIQTLSNNHMNLSLEDTTSSLYDFSGRVDKVKSTQKTGTNQTLHVTNRYEYDHAGRVLAIYQQNNSDSEVRLATYAYNELGQMTSKKLHSTNNGSTHIQSVDYAYNIRGWLKQINDPDNLQSDQYWGLKLYYEDNLSGQTLSYNGNITATKWGNNSSGTPSVKGYTYTYDKMDRLTTANYGEGTTLSQNTGTYTVNNLAYDANGNINQLNRTAADTVGSTVIDQLTFSYTGNKLIGVADAKPARGFSDGQNSGDDYSYDDMGNLLTDQNKGIDAIVYNVINKVDSIHFSDGRAIAYIYSASGQKLAMKTYHADTLTKTTDYVGNAMYENQALKLFGTSEGRVIVDQNQNLEYEYALSDHTGNTRVVFTASPDVATYTTTLEDSTYAQDTLYFYNINNRTNHPASAQGKAVGLNVNNIVGPAISLPVYPGDTIDLSVRAYYDQSSGHGTTGSGLSAIVAAASTAFGTLGIAENGATIVNNAINDGLTTLGLGGNNGDNHPSAYMTYLVYDKNFKYLSGGHVGVTQNPVVLQDLALTGLVINEPGYVFVYVSNESNSANLVYFDDFSVTHKEGRVQQYNEYYPFGLITDQSWERVWSQPNKYLYNGGSNLNETTHNYQTFFRQYDPTIGRFTGIDPLASSFASTTPYNYAFNDPIGLNDPSGAAPNLDNMQRLAAEADKIGDGTYRGDFVGWGRRYNHGLIGNFPGYTGRFLTLGGMINEAWNSTPEGGVSVTNYNNGSIVNRYSTTNYSVIGDGNGNGSVLVEVDGELLKLLSVGTGFGFNYSYGPGHSGYDGEIHALGPGLMAGPVYGNDMAVPYRSDYPEGSFGDFLFKIDKAMYENSLLPGFSVFGTTARLGSSLIARYMRGVFTKFLNKVPGGAIVRSVVKKGITKTDYLFRNKDKALNWARKQLGHNTKELKNARGQVIGWENEVGDTVYWGHNDWYKGKGSSTFPHLNYEIGGSKGHLFLEDKIINSGLLDDFISYFKLL